MMWTWKKRIILQEEEKLQIECVRWFERTHPHLKECLHHSPNEGKRGWFERIKLNKMGMRCGFPDLVLFVPRQGFSALCMELKTAKGRLSEKQLKVLFALGKYGGCKTTIIRSLSDFRNAIENYIK